MSGSRAVSTITGITESAGYCCRFLSTANPSPAGNPRSRTIRWGCSFCAMAMAEYPSHTLIVSKLLARRRRLNACLRSGSSSTTIIFARFMGSASALFSVRMFLFLLFDQTLFIPKVLLDHFGDIVGDAPDLLLQRPRISGWRPGHVFSGHRYSAGGLQLGLSSKLIANTIHQDLCLLHVGGCNHEKCFDRTGAPSGRKNQILVHIDTLTQQFETLLAGILPASAARFRQRR